MNDRRYLDAVAQEQRDNKFDEGLWFKAMAAADNNREHARSSYVALRVEQMKQRHEELLKAQRAAGKTFSACPRCGCAGPFASRLVKKMATLVALLPLLGFYWIWADLQMAVDEMVHYKKVLDEPSLSTLLMYVLVFVGPMFVVMLTMRNAAKCPSCGYTFWYDKKRPEGDSMIKSL